MKIKNTIKILITGILITLFIGNPVYAFYGNDEDSEGNVLSASSLDMGLVSDTDDFEPEEIAPNETAKRNIFVQKIGDIPFAYSQEYEFIEGDSDLCEELDLKVWYYWYEGDENNKILKKKLVYDDKLEDFEISFLSGEELLEHPNENVYVQNDDYEEEEHWFYYEVDLPEDASDELADKSCTFNFLAKAWMHDYSFGQAYYDSETIENTISTGEWEDLACEIETTEIDLIAGQHIDIGSVNIWNDGTNLYVQYDAEDDWYLEEVQMHIADSYDDLPQNNGNNPQIGQFDYKEEFDPMVQQHTFVVPLEDLPDGTLYIATHASVKKLDENGEVEEQQTAWGDGEDFEGNNWAMYFTHELQQCVEEGAVIINEIMWSGTDLSSADEWIELKNTTDEEIDLEGWILENAGTSGDPNIELEGVIPADGYYLISNYETGSSRISDSITPDLITTDVSLDNSGEKLVLKDYQGRTIDETPNAGDGWAAGEKVTSGEAEGNEELEEVYRSMERNSDPGDGSDVSSWHTCLDAVCNDTTYWDTESINHGTPKSLNHSDNDLSLQKVEDNSTENNETNDSAEENDEEEEEKEENSDSNDNDSNNSKEDEDNEENNDEEQTSEQNTDDESEQDDESDQEKKNDTEDSEKQDDENENNTETEEESSEQETEEENNVEEVEDDTDGDNST